MNERDLEARLRRTYRAEAERADPGALAQRVHSIPATAEPERRRWWHGLGFGVTRYAGPGGEQVTGGTNMLTAMRLAAVVAVLALGASLLAVRVGGPAEPGSSGAIEAGGAWVTVTGTQVPGEPGNPYPATNRMSDPRVDGDVEISWSQADGSAIDQGNYALWGTVTITNEGGTWQGRFIGFVDDQGRHHATVWYEGTGDYEELSYLEQLAQPEANGPLNVTGLIFEGPIPSTVVPPELVE